MATLPSMASPSVMVSIGSCPKVAVGRQGLLVPGAQVKARSGRRTRSRSGSRSGASRLDRCGRRRRRRSRARSRAGAGGRDGGQQDEDDGRAHALHQRREPWIMVPSSPIYASKFLRQGCAREGSQAIAGVTRRKRWFERLGFCISSWLGCSWPGSWCRSSSSASACSATLRSAPLTRASDGSCTSRRCSSCSSRRCRAPAAGTGNGRCYSPPSSSWCPFLSLCAAPRRSSRRFIR